MGSMSIVHWMIVIGVVALLFGRTKISDLMGDVAHGIKSFKKGMAEDEPAVVKTDGMQPQDRTGSQMLPAPAPSAGSGQEKDEIDHRERHDHQA
jgi:sec-independent protein translocase protein TatA